MIERFERFSFAISGISRYWHKIVADEMESYGLKGPYALYLVALHRHEAGLTAARLGELCGRDKADVSRVLGLMEDKGLVTRGGEPRYRARVQLTEQGRLAAEHVCDRACLAVSIAGADIPEEEREIFYRTLERIAGNIRSISEDGLPSEAER